MVSVCTVPARGGRSCEHFGGYKTINRIPLCTDGSLKQRRVLDRTAVDSARPFLGMTCSRSWPSSHSLIAVSRAMLCMLPNSVQPCKRIIYRERIRSCPHSFTFGYVHF